ncbi:GTP-binding protein [Mangrovimicrobium sediminis]|uniref:GTP-binding protein n=2 Tax=Mangrovimicrobium sediminis TaxID=2562682 RepID=A0A4Z0M069_9GAMM|nr:GTP-binding protein [Haliea sp. SAOS-164]
MTENFLDLDGVESSDIKIVFSGPVGAGKSQAIRTVSDIEVVQTDVVATDEVQDSKETTTVAMDYGELQLDADTTLALYGTPGQERFRFMWDILIKGALGVVLMVDDSAPDPLGDLETYLQNFSHHIAQSTAVVGVTHTDVAASSGMEKYYEYMEQKGYFFPIYPIDARKAEDVNLLLQSLTAMLEIGG